MALARPFDHVAAQMTPSADRLLEALLTQTSVGLAFFDRELRYVHINETLARINGVPASAHKGRALREILPLLADEVQAIAAEVDRTRQPVTKEISGETPAQPGVVRTWHDHWFPVFDDTGDIAGYGVLVEETTARTEALTARDSLIDALRTSEDRLHFTLIRGGVAIWEYDPATDRTVWIGDTLGTYGYAPEDMPQLGGDYKRLLHPDDLEPTMAVYAEAMQQGVECRQDFRVCWPDGSTHWLHGRAQPQYDSERRLVHVTGINTNVTERYEAAAALRSSEERLRLSMEAAYLIGFSWDIERDEVHRLHSASAALPATTPAQPVRFADVLARVLPEDRPRFEERIQAAFKDPGGRYESEFRVVETDGEIRWLYERGIVARHSDGRVHSLSGLSQDITARKNAEQALLDANRRKDEFLATLAHELRNPLAPIRSATEILRMKDVPATTTERAVDIIDRQVTQMVRLVDDLLDVNRITRGDIALQQETLDFTRIVHAAIETSRPLIESAQHELQLSLPFAPALVWGDAARLAQALSNLLNNAARYTPPGGRIGVEVVRERGRVRVCVKDNGRGIPAARLHDVFDMFTRIGPADGQAGLGIGLALVKRIVQLHGGEIRARSDGEGKGATFEFWLPFVGAEPGALTVAPRATDTPLVIDTPSEASPVTHERSLRILIVDDNVDFAASEATMLELRHHIVCVVHDAEEALQVVKIFSPDVALLDIGLPGMSGYELARQLRADPEHADIVLIAQTGWGQPSDRDKALATGFDAHLTKPVDWEKLGRVLAALVPVNREV